MVGSVDRHAQPDQPGPAGRPDAAQEQPTSPRETEAQLAERLGLPTLTRASAYESLYAKAMAQDAPFRERLAREEAAGKRESLSEAGESHTPQDPPKPPIDKPERDLETTRNYWTEVPRFFALWERIAEKWHEKWHMDSDSAIGRRDYDVSPGKCAKAVEEVAKIPRAELSISDTVRNAERQTPYLGWLAGYDCRLKGGDRLMEKVLESLDAQPDATPEEVVGHIPDAIRYTFCFKKDDYSAGFSDVKSRLESAEHEMYYSKNSWSDAEYKGINTRWVTPGGQRFEVQFHTLESFHAKHEVTHKAYERLRDPKTTRAEREDLQAFQREVSSWIPIPRRVEEIPNYKKEGF